MFDLVLEAPSECPDARALRDQVARLASVDAGTSGRLVARVTIETIGHGRWSLTMQTEQNGRQGERALDGPSCRAVTDAAALTLALMLNPEAHQPSEAATPPTGRPATIQRRPPPRLLPRPASKHLVVGGTAQVGLHVGALPRPGPDISLGIAAGVGRASLWLLGSYAPEQEKLVQPDRGGQLWMLAGAALGCWQPVRGTPSVGPCLGASFNWIRGQGIVRHPRSGTVYWVSPTAGILADLPLGSWMAVRAVALGQLPLARPMAYLERIGSVHRPARAEARMLAGVLIGPR
ncbi:MAG: hypothetical protein JW940_02905 [Polyangiaceae bacterium]|nr:hypothetical protein [Polyangiaceae bacterium]